MKGKFRGLEAFALTEARVQLHEYLAIASGLMVQLIFIFFVWLMARALLPFALVGSLLFSVFVIGERVLDEAAYVRVDHKLNELYHASPMSPESYFLGMGIGMLIANLPTFALLAGASEIVHPFSLLAALVMVGACFGVWSFAAGLGYVASTFFKDMRAIWPYASLLFNLFGVLPPVFYPLTFFPASLQPVALAMPPSAAAALVMHALGPLSLTSGQVLLAGSSLVLESLGVLLFALYWSRRSSRES